ncbi:MAG: hypothetical protein IJ560_04480 [Alphaproteobacteria bacterium]|nr:hypothetical protein [Alphaproteobacteria bacterium]
MLFPTNELVFMPQNDRPYTPKVFIEHVGVDTTLNVVMPPVYNDEQKSKISEYMKTAFNRLNHATRTDLFNQIQNHQQFLPQTNMANAR